VKKLKKKLWTARDTKKKKMQEATQRPLTQSFAMKHKIQTSLLVAQTTPKKIHQKNSKKFGMILASKLQMGCQIPTSKPGT